MNPVALPMRGHSDQLEERRLAARGRRARLRLQHPFEVARHDLDEQRLQRLEALEDTRSELAAGVLNVANDQAPDQLDVFGIVERLELDHLGVAAPLKRVVWIQHIRDAAAHPRGEVASGLAED